MAQFVVRQLEETVETGPKRRAERHGRSLEEEVLVILRDAAREEQRLVANLGSRIAERFRGVGLSVDLAELHDHSRRPAPFGK
jgi:antitoxin FitA